MFKKWWLNQKFDRKLGIIIGLLGFLIILQLFVLIFSMSILSTTRILVAGEGYWSKAQKDATNALILYTITQNEDYYVQFFHHVKIPAGDKIARLELMKEHFDHNLASRSFVQGGNHPEDIPTAITNIRRFRNMPGMADALKEWEKADQSLEKMISLAIQINKDFKTRRYSTVEVNERLTKIAQYNQEMTKFEVEFSNVLGKLSRSIEDFITFALLAAVLTVISIGFILMRSFNASFAGAIKNLQDGINQVKQGKFHNTLPIKSYDEFGELTQVINDMFVSIREEIDSRETAEESQARLASLADAMPLIVYIITPDYANVTFCNKRFWDFLGKKPSDPSEIKWTDFIHPEDASIGEKAFREANKNFTTCVTEVRARNAKGEYVWFLVRSEPIIQNGVITHWYGTMVDISEQRFIRDALQNAIRVRDEFLSIASHELKTPLTSLLLQTQMRKRYIEKGETSRFTPEKLLVMKTADENQLKRLISLVDEMLDISRIRSGKLSINKTHFNFKDLLLEISLRFELQVQEKNTSLSIQCDKDYFIDWDRYRLQQVIENLLTNAIKYGNRTPILIKVWDTPHSLFFSVKDQGPGIKESDAQRIFERFERATTASEASGLGLGLYIVKKIVNAHGGIISVKSAPNEGAEFIVEIPFEKQVT